MQDTLIAERQLQETRTDRVVLQGELPVRSLDLRLVSCLGDLKGVVVVPPAPTSLIATRFSLQQGKLVHNSATTSRRMSDSLRAKEL